jgi:hypothetical protein
MGFCMRQNFGRNFEESCCHSGVNHNELGVNAMLMLLKLHSIDMSGLEVSRGCYLLSLKGEKINISILGNFYFIYSQRSTRQIYIPCVGSNSACQKESIAQFFVIFRAFLGVRQNFGLEIPKNTEIEKSAC